MKAFLLSYFSTFLRSFVVQIELINKKNLIRIVLDGIMRKYFVRFMWNRLFAAHYFYGAPLALALCLKYRSAVPAPALSIF